jgi:hypothetical protein
MYVRTRAREGVGHVPTSFDLRVTFGLLSLLVAIGSGCGHQGPKVSVSDPAVFTVLHLRAAELAYEADTGSIQTHLTRYFGVKAKEYDEKKTRMDQMLDSQQRRSAYMQVVQTVVAIKAVADILKAPIFPAPTTAPTTAPSASAPATMPAVPDISGQATALKKELADILTKYFDKLQDQVAGDISDSPFDQLDRASDFYSSYLIKLLRLQGDSRVLDDRELVHLIDTFRTATTRPGSVPDDQLLINYKAKSPNPADNDRLLLMVFQSEIDPGAKANMMAGVRVEIKSTEPEIPLDRVRVLRLHPARNYDVESTSAGEASQQAASVALEATVPTQYANVAASGQADRVAASEARQRFLSRISKTASYADAGRHQFGWNFYPSNLEVVRQNLIEAIGNLFAGDPTKYRVKGYLEGGGRDCSAVMLVPANLKSITFKVWYVTASVDRLVTTGGENHESDAGEFKVLLPTWDAAETGAATRGLPVLFAAPAMR